jgi:hypothetical protein
MWEPGAGAHTYDAGKALDAGLRHRPFREIVGDTIAWGEPRPPTMEPIWSRAATASPSFVAELGATALADVAARVG